MSNSILDKETQRFLLERAQKLRKIKNQKSSVYGQGRAYNQVKLAEILDTGRKICTECRMEKSLADFSARPQHPTGRKSSCKSCDVRRMTIYRHKDIDAARIRDRILHYMRKYGMSEIEATALVENRTGLCEICRKIKSLVVDHCHATGKVRGKLCSGCNTVLGYVEENVDTLLSAAEYLNRNKEDGTS